MIRNVIMRIVRIDRIMDNDDKTETNTVITVINKIVEKKDNY